MPTAIKAFSIVSMVLGLSLAPGAQQSGWRADPEAIASSAKRLPDANFDEARVEPFELPDPLKTSTGRVTTRDGWKARRAELLELFRAHVYGRSPGTPEGLRFETLEEQGSALNGTATLKRVAVHSTHQGREHRFELRIFLPNAVSGPAPLFLLMNNRSASITDPARIEKSGFWPAEEVIARGFGIAAFQNGDLAPDDKARYREGVIRLFEGTASGPRAPDAWAALAAWGWGASRAMDYFETDRRIDARRIALVGHSRGGKAALWAGAEDERFAMVISNESGEGGAALTRRNYGETLARITRTFPHWFAGAYAAYAGREGALPVDQHMLIALIANRAVYVASADRDLWSDPRGEFLSLAYASPVYALWGGPAIDPDDMPALDTPLIVGRRGYHVRTGSHDLASYDWARYMDFADRFSRSGSAAR